MISESIQVYDNHIDKQEFFNALSLIDNVIDAETAQECVDNVKRLEDMLKAADKFGEYACQFCLLEAKMWVRIVKMSRDPNIGSEINLMLYRSNKSALAGWLQQKTDAELEDICTQCSNGTRISRIKARETRAQNERTVLAEYDRISSKIRSEMSETGRTNLSTIRFYDEWKHEYKPKKDTVRAYVEKTRDDLLQSGGIGLGDQSGTYVLAKSCDRKEVAQAISARLRSIMGDLNSIRDICSETHFGVPAAGIEKIRKVLDELEVK